MINTRTFEMSGPNMTVTWTCCGAESRVRYPHKEQAQNQPRESRLPCVKGPAIFPWLGKGFLARPDELGRMFAQIDSRIEIAKSRLSSKPTLYEDMMISLMFRCAETPEQVADLTASVIKTVQNRTGTKMTALEVLHRALEITEGLQDRPSCSGRFANIATFESLRQGVRLKMLCPFYGVRVTMNEESLL